jgi:hypothetical protein
VLEAELASARRDRLGVLEAVADLRRGVGGDLVLGVEGQEDLEVAVAALALVVHRVHERLEAIDLGEIPAAVPGELDGALERGGRVLEVQLVVELAGAGEVGIRATLGVAAAGLPEGERWVEGAHVEERHR